MKIAKKIAAALLAAAMAFTALVIPVGADSIYDTAKEAISGTKYTSTHPKTWDYADYKVKVSKSGVLSIDITAGLVRAILYVFDSDGNSIACDGYSIKTGTLGKIGDDNISFDWNDKTETIVFNATYQVNKGTYYIRVKDETLWGSDSYKFGNRKVSFTATYPGTTVKKAKISYININLAKGSTLSLGATVTNGGTVTWKSSNSSVVTVSSAGSITAKGRGSAIITAKCGSSSKKVKIVVS